MRGSEKSGRMLGFWWSPGSAVMRMTNIFPAHMDIAHRDIFFFKGKHSFNHKFQIIYIKYSVMKTQNAELVNKG